MAPSPLPDPGARRVPAPVSLDPPSGHGVLDQLVVDAATAGRDIGLALDLARSWEPRLPRPGAGRTSLLWEALATVAAVDLQVARVLEPHLDAAAIRHEQDGRSLPEASTWGVFAAEGSGLRLTAQPKGDEAPSDAWVLTGVKPWCSLGGRLSHAMITAWVGDERRLFEVGLTHPGVRVADQEWVAHGLPQVRSTALEMTDVPAVPVGEPRWYLERDGFAWGGVGVAAVWFGGAVGLSRTLQDALVSGSRAPDQLALMHLGAVDLAIHSARATLAEAAADVDAGRASGPNGALLAQRVRGVVAGAVELVLTHVAHALGPGPLALDAEHAARVADLSLYVRQHHAERDLASLGGLVAAPITQGTP